MTTTHPASTVQPATGRRTGLAATITLTVSYLLMVPFWVATGESVAAHALPPGSPALFTGGILLVAVGAGFQWRLVHGGKGVAADRRPITIALLVFFSAMTAGNAAIIAEMAAVHTTWTSWDSIWMATAGTVFVMLLVVLAHTNVRPVAVQVAAALAGRVAIQVAIAVWELVAGVSMPGALLLFIAAFGGCRVVPVVLQWRRSRQVPALALLVTETTNAASLLLLGVAWLAATP
jgi:hypothetical protein